MGGYIDLTAGVSGEEKSSKSIKPGKAIKKLLKNGVSIEKITISSDGNGSLPKFNEKKEFVGMRIASVSSLHKEFINMVKEENIAKHLKLDKKGEIRTGKDADIIVLDKDTLKIKHVIARGKTLMEDEEVVKFGIFEKE